AEDDLPFVANDGFETGDNRGTLRRVARQETQAGAVGAGFGQRDAKRSGDLAQEFVRHLDQDAGAVAGVDLAAAGAAMLEVAQQFEPLLDDRGGPLPLQMDA